MTPVAANVGGKYRKVSGGDESSPWEAEEIRNPGASRESPERAKEGNHSEEKS